MTRTVSVAGNAIVIRESKTLLNGDYTCLMSPWTGCDTVLNDSVKDPKDPKYSKCGDCPNCYGILQYLWSNFDVTRAQMEAAGMIRTHKRQAKHRVMSTLTGKAAL